MKPKHDRTPEQFGRAALTARGLKPAAQLAQARPHGDRLRYVGGCRCDLCRRANSSYESARQKARKAGDWNGIVAADKARAHLLQLSELNVGRRSVAAVSDVTESVLFEIRSGRKARIRARTERRILAVTPDAAADHALIDAGPTWQRIDDLLAAGFTRATIALRTGHQRAALQLDKHQVTVRNAYLVERLHAELMASGELLVDAKPTWRLIDELLAEWFSIKDLARRLKVAESALETRKKRIPAGFARAIAALHQELTT